MKEIPQKELMAKMKSTHAVWHKFSNWLEKTYGEGLYGEWQYSEIVGDNGKKYKWKYRGFNDYELSKRLVGSEVMDKIEKYVKRSCPEIKILRCDDDHHATSFLLLVPHPKMGITVMYIPQCTSVQNTFFLYENHCNNLIKALTEMKSVYKGSL